MNAAGIGLPDAMASDAYIESLSHIVTLNKNNNTKLPIRTAAK